MSIIVSDPPLFDKFVTMKYGYKCSVIKTKSFFILFTCVFFLLILVLVGKTQYKNAKVNVTVDKAKTVLEETKFNIIETKVFANTSSKQKDAKKPSM